MSKKLKLLAFGVLSIGIFLLAVRYFHAHPVAVLDPKGIIAAQERNLIIVITLLMLIVVLPVFALTFGIAWKYREANKATYRPDWDHDRLAETVWWVVPLVLIMTISAITWRSSHELDPFRPLSSAQPTMTIQVVALEWKWLFIYPKEQIATLNYVQFPEDTPVDFQITADAPMNSFWIPQLGGQIYAMAGMSTHLHLMADGSGTYRGSSANLSGAGFAGMKFRAESTSQTDFDDWVKSVKQSDTKLSAKAYAKLVQPSQNNQPQFYASQPAGLYDSILTKYMPYMHHTEDRTPEASNG